MRKTSGSGLLEVLLASALLLSAMMVITKHYLHCVRLTADASKMTDSSWASVQKKTMAPRRQGSGLIEVMVALALGVVLSVFVVGLLQQFRHHYRWLIASSALQHQARLSSVLLTKLLQNMHFSGCRTGIIQTDVALEAYHYPLPKHMRGRAVPGAMGLSFLQLKVTPSIDNQSQRYMLVGEGLAADIGETGWVADCLTAEPVTIAALSQHPGVTRIQWARPLEHVTHADALFIQGSPASLYLVADKQHQTRVLTYQYGHRSREPLLNDVMDLQFQFKSASSSEQGFVDFATATKQGNIEWIKVGLLFRSRLPVLQARLQQFTILGHHVQFHDGYLYKPWTVIVRVGRAG